jgi:hypothetical protein
MGIGPLVAWRSRSCGASSSLSPWPARLALVTGRRLLALGAGSSIPG